MAHPGFFENDQLSRFLLEPSGVRGVLVNLRDTWQAIRQRSPYPDAVAERLGETCAAAALFTGHAKVDGRLSVQLRGTGALRTLFAECTAAGTLRGIAQYREPLPDPLTPQAFGPGSILAITIENLPPGGRDLHRYQGMVELQADHLSGAFEAYFRQSEQLPTRLLLAADSEQAGALMLQQLPDGHGDPDGWTRCSALFDTLGTAELLRMPGSELLRRLFHQETLRPLGQRPLSFACSCSRTRVEDVLRGLGADEAIAACQNGPAEIHCDFCGQGYRFEAPEVTKLFALAAENAPGSARLQ